MDNTMSDKLEVEIAGMRSDISYMKDAIKTMAEAVNKLARVEERQTSQGEILQRMINRLETLEEKQHESKIHNLKLIEVVERTAKIEGVTDNLTTKEVVLTTQIKTVMDSLKIFWVLFGGVIMAFLGKLFGVY